jgi:demethylmenaquinone methyltransferase/2-methoxy-6-polyprenyl-1,4-benzoquinol methylase
MESKNRDHNQLVQDIFTSIAHRYDVMNGVMTGGQDVNWRREVIRRTELTPGGQLLDIGAGTGDLAFEALRQHPDCRVMAVDFTDRMLQIGLERARKRGIDHARLAWSAADGLYLPFEDNAFDAVVSGFFLRNVSDLPTCLAEQLRVLRQGGVMVALDTTPPPESLLKPLMLFHLRVVIPLLGRIISGKEGPYRYLPASTEAFLYPQQIAIRMKEAGFCATAYRSLMGGAVAIYWGRKGKPKMVKAVTREKR